MSTSVQYQTKHLTVVEKTATGAYTSVGNGYGMAREKALSYSPGFVGNMVSTVESYLKPVMDFGKNNASNALLLADKTVDNGMSAVSSTARYSRKQAGNIVGEERMQPVDKLIGHATTAAQDGYETLRSEGLIGAAKASYVKARGVLGQLSEIVRTGATDVRNTLNDGGEAVRRKVSTAHNALYKDYVKPAANRSVRACSHVRDAIAQQPLYASLHSYVTKTFNYAAGLPIVKAPLNFANTYCYPYLQPVADPVLQRTKPLLGSVRQQLRPQAPPAGGNNGSAAMRKVDEGKKAAKRQAKQAQQGTQQAADQAREGAQQAKGEVKKHVQ